MSLSLLTRPEAVHAALEEHDQLGPEAFRTRYGYGPARTYVLVHKGRRYDSKAIAGVAVGKQNPDRGPLRADEFSGGVDTVKAKLESLGFTVEHMNQVPSPQAPFGLDQAEAAIRAALGEPIAANEKLSAWRTSAGRELVLQRDVSTVQVWTEDQPPPHPDLALKQYLPEKTRHSNLKGLAPRLAQPFEAWLAYVHAGAALQALLDWYSALPPSALDADALEEMRTEFLRHMEGFVSFEAPGETYELQERRYKDELRTLFTQEVQPLAVEARETPDGARKIVEAVGGLLTRKLTTGSPQNLLNWRYFDALRKMTPEARALLGAALGDLLTTSAPLLERMATFIQAGRAAFTDGPSALAGDLTRGLGSFVAMLAWPDQGILVRVTLFDEALKRLKRSRLPTNADEAGRFRAGVELAQQLRDALIDWGWKPRDLIDVQGFLWVSLMYGQEDLDAVDTSAAAEPEPPAPTDAAYSLDDALEELFLDRVQLERMLAIWRAKKNLILQGAPGVGKSFMARKLAFALMGECAEARIAAIQFHQSYGYEDFIQGYRPTADGGFQLKDGVFYRFCLKAKAAPEQPHVFIIDEINRGNLSKIFGELMLLIEHDKRSAEWGAQLAYAGADEAPFWIPPNLYLLGMMNTADRSLSLVDYALRRRFAFVPLDPAFESAKFQTCLANRGVPRDTIDHIVGQMSALNAEIASDKVNLGLGFRIGHSFFTPGRDFTYDPRWVSRVVETEIQPLLEEYWFDDPLKAEEWTARLRDA